MVMSCNIYTCHRCYLVILVTNKVSKAAMSEPGKKLFVGPRFRRIRQQLGLSQTQIAEGLGISPSYVNLIERNQRPVTAQILLRLAGTHDLDLRDLAELCPGVTHSLQRLYAAYTEARRGETMVAAQMADRDEGTRFEAN